jgi:uncharacterized protein YbaP (TraB family)
MRHGFGVVCITGAIAISFGSPLARAGSNAAIQKHCFWRVTNAKAPFYLLGSVHSLLPSDYDRSATIEKAIQQSQQIFFEIDPKDHDLFAQKLTAAAKLPNGQTIAARITPRACDNLRSMTTSGSDQWRHMYPWAVAMLLQDSRLQGVTYTYGVDHYVAEKARRYSKTMHGLETVDEHVGVFSQMQDADGEAYLLQAMRHAKDAPRRYRQDVAAWRAGDTNRLYSLQAREAREAPGVWWRLLDERNAKWLPKIEAAIDSGTPTLVVAGVLHFVGPHSLLALLEQRGYRIEQL